MSLPEEYLPESENKKRKPGRMSWTIWLPAVALSSYVVTHHGHLPWHRSSHADAASSHWVVPTPYPEGSDGWYLTHHWSNTSPRINLEHIFHGEFNRWAKPRGFHARPGKKNPDDAWVLQVISGPNRFGVYEAEVWIVATLAEVRLAEQLFKTDVVEKGGASKLSTFFPDALSASGVVSTILDAARGSCRRLTHYYNGDKYKCRTDLGFSMYLWTDADGDINTAYPIYVSDTWSY